MDRKCLRVAEDLNDLFTSPETQGALQFVIKTHPEHYLHATTELAVVEVPVQISGNTQRKCENNLFTLPKPGV